MVFCTKNSALGWEDDSAGKTLATLGPWMLGRHVTCLYPQCLGDGEGASPDQDGWIREFLVQMKDLVSVNKVENFGRCAVSTINLHRHEYTHLYTHTWHTNSLVSLLFFLMSQWVFGTWQIPKNLLTKTVRPKPWNGKRERQLAPHNLPEASLQPFMWATGVVSPWHPHLWWKQASCSAVSEHYVERTAVPFFLQSSRFRGSLRHQCMPNTEWQLGWREPPWRPNTWP